MKQTLLIITFLLSGYLQNFAQNYETFVTEMKKLEQEEKEYSGILFRKNDYSAEYKKGFEPKLKKVREEKVTLARKAIEANPDDKRFVDVLNFYLFNYLSIEELDRMLDRFTADARQHPMWKSMKSYVTYKPLNAVGHKAFDFTVKGHDGKKITLSKVLKKNKVVLVDFWASWCGPCRGENPHVVEIYKEYHPKGLEIFGVSLDNNKEAWVKAIADDGLVWKHGSDLKGWQSAPAQLYSVSGIPHTVLLDENNKIIAKNLRGDELKQKIAELLK